VRGLQGARVVASWEGSRRTAAGFARPATEFGVDLAYTLAECRSMSALERLSVPYQQN